MFLLDANYRLWLDVTGSYLLGLIPALCVYIHILMRHYVKERLSFLDVDAQVSVCWFESRVFD